MKASRKKRVSGATLFFFLLSVVLAVLLYKTRSRPERVAPRLLRTPAPTAAAVRPSRPRAERTPRSLPSPAAAAPSPGGAPAEPRRSEALPAIAILIDDLGNDRAAAERIARWPYAVSGAVLPELAGSAETARELARSGKDVLLHLPMEPKGYPAIRPGPGVVLLSQSNDEIAATLARDLETVPGATGVNNHMGSAATADARVMAAVAGVLARRGLFFVDSRTTQATVAFDAVHRAGVRSASRRVFLDDVAREDAIETELSGLVERARAEGSAIAIGHPYPSTLAVLERELPRLEGRGVRLVRVSELVR